MKDATIAAAVGASNVVIRTANITAAQVGAISNGQHNVVLGTNLSVGGSISARSVGGGSTDLTLTSPNGAQKLTMSGSDGGPFVALGTSGTSDQYGKFGAYNSVLNFQANGRNLNLRSDTLASIMLANATNGNVGVGTTTPSEKLHVSGNVLSSGSVTASNFVQSAGGWNDLSFPVQNIYAQGLTDIEYLAVSNSVLFKSTCNTNFASDNAWLVGQLPHSAATNAAYVAPHVHFIQSSATQTNMFFIRYKTYKTGGQVPATWTDLPLTNNTFPYTTGTIHQIAYGSGILGPFGISQNFDIKIWSRGGTACQMKYFDIHYRQDSFGSDQELSKGF
jgi:hypothetical protein